MNDYIHRVDDVFHFPSGNISIHPWPGPGDGARGSPGQRPQGRHGLTPRRHGRTRGGGTGTSRPVEDG